ncbi:hypothetical protein GUJ93_ZPchr0014g46764 [Zizania palustris]|uniref:Uncharacterized protein n=1 Tax=Zizania palustris TaxID=103762 RepID=A0A8J5TLG0_ZIZPA|nr:hypothetical protein GUJ93_ZPchr0014g46764 [Zizania palustris]
MWRNRNARLSTRRRLRRLTEQPALPPTLKAGLRFATRHGKNGTTLGQAAMARYRRTISFPAPRPAAVFAGASAKEKLAAAYRVRSASLPCRFHPLVLQLDDDVAALRLVIGQQSPSADVAPSAPSVSAAASQVGRVLVSLDELLHHPQAQEPLRRLGRSTFAERLLDDLLRLADAHGSFREKLVALSALQAATRAALRRGDPARLASAARAQRREGRDLPRLAAAARAVASKAAPKQLPEDLPADTAALAAAIADATIAVSSGSAAVFSGLSSLSNSAAAARVEVASTPCWVTAPARLTTASDAPPSTTSHHRIWWVADLVRWMSRAKRRSAEKQNGGDDDESSTVRLRSVPRTKPSERARKAAFERHDNLERCIASVDSSGEKVFRALVNTRVSLLNILSSSF